MKAEGISRFVYPTISLCVDDLYCKEINNMFVKFIWKNGHHRLKKEVIQAKKSEGGLDLINFLDLNYTFKVKWLKKYLENPTSLWNFISHNIFSQIGGLKLLMSCTYNVSKLPIKLSKFHQQALLAWRLCYVHNFSPHKEILWNNENITIKRKSLYKKNWFERGIVFVSDLFDSHGNLYNYETFLKETSIPIKNKEYCEVIQAIPSGMKSLMESHLKYQTCARIIPELSLLSAKLTDAKCTNKLIRNSLTNQFKITPRGKAFWNSQIQPINWKKVWSTPFQFCISNKIREIHFKILHNIYPCNSIISKFASIDNTCAFCGTENETTIHLFYFCQYSLELWENIAAVISAKSRYPVNFTAKDIIASKVGALLVMSVSIIKMPATM